MSAMNSVVRSTVAAGERNEGRFSKPWNTRIDTLIIVVILFGFLDAVSNLFQKSRNIVILHVDTLREIQACRGKVEYALDAGVMIGTTSSGATLGRRRYDDDRDVVLLDAFSKHSMW